MHVISVSVSIIIVLYWQGMVGTVPGLNQDGLRTKVRQEKILQLKNWSLIVNYRWTHCVAVPKH